MRPRHALRAGQIGDSARHAQDAMIAARRQLHALGGFGQKPGARRIGLGDGVQQFAVRFGIGADGKALEAFALDGRALATLAATSALPSAGGGKVRSLAVTAATSTCRSMRSNSGTKMRCW